jgi:acyl transferase domain-containing protein
VSAFGLSGTNVHVVVEEGRQGGGGGASRPAPSRRPGEKVLVLSARSEPALRALAQRYLDLVTADDTPDLADLAHSAAVGRAHLDHRLAIPATTIPEAAERLRDYLVGDASAAYVGTAISTPQLAFAFGDVGPSFPGFGPLPGDERVMREALEECLSLIPEVLPGSVLPVAHDLDGQARRQPALRAPLLVAVQFAYAKLLLSWGAEPVVVSGEGAGEYTAGCVAGVLPLRTALFLAARHRPTAELVPAAEKTAADEVAAVLAGTRFGEPWCGVVSMRSGNSVESRIGTADYWLAPRTASPSDVPGATVFADIGAIVRFGSAASLSSPSPKQVPQPVELSAFDPNAPGDQSRIIAGQLYVLGTDLDLARIQPGSATGRIELPRYPFQRQRHWEKFRATSSA